MTPTELSTRIKEHALALGFDLVGIAPLRESDHGEFYRRWLAEGRHGEMAYLAREDAVARRIDPRTAYPALRSAIVVAQSYDPGDGDAAPGDVASERVRAPAAPNAPAGSSRRAPPPATAGDPSRAIIARYARGRDYHKVLKKKLLALLERIEEEVGHELPAARAYVDTGPVFERELARRAGLGWFGRSTMLIHPRRGSFFFLGSLLVELDLEPDAPFEADRCGRCSACVDACPTGALLGRDAAGAPVIDATRCIAYLTIELRGPIPRELRPLIGNRVFGCDICQEVCPFTRKFSVPTSEPAFMPREGAVAPALVELMALSREEWDRRSAGSAIRRAGYAGLLRNVAVALGNWGSEEALPALVDALSHEEPLVRGHAAWALGRIASPDAVAALEAARDVERDPFVREEMELALLVLHPPPRHPDPVDVHARSSSS
jgi:epoxyqueuosine reductase